MLKSDREGDRGVFESQGYLHLPAVFGLDELEVVRRETRDLIDNVCAGGSDIACDLLPSGTGELVPYRVRPIMTVCEGAHLLAASGKIRRVATDMIGASATQYDDAMVFKLPTQGFGRPWHRDEAYRNVAARQMINIGVYLDDADSTSRVWMIPGSHQVQDRKAVDTTLAEPIQARAGDLLVHHVLTVHASYTSSGPLRRVIYLGFRASESELI
jgi:hypothetical protein